MRVHIIVSSSASESDCDGSSSCQNCDNAVDLLLRILVGRQDYVAYQRNMESTAQNSCDGWNNTGYQRGTPFIVVKLHNKRSLVFFEVNSSSLDPPLSFTSGGTVKQLSYATRKLPKRTFLPCQSGVFLVQNLEIRNRTMNQSTWSIIPI